MIVNSIKLKDENKGEIVNIENKIEIKEKMGV